MTFPLALPSRWRLGALASVVLTANAVGQAPEIIEYNFDAGDATNTAIPGVGDGVPNAGVLFGSGGICTGSGDPAASSDGTAMIASGWTVDVGMSDWSVGMHLDLTAGGAGFQYYFGSSSASSYRCFSRGAAGAGGIMLRMPTGADVVIAGGASDTEKTHVVWVYDSSVPEVRGYLDGALNVTVAQPGLVNLVGTAADFNVMTYTTTEMLAGNIMDDFRFYRRAIDQAEIDGWLKCGDVGGDIGTNYCGPAAMNSSGNSGEISAFGSEDVADNDVRLDATLLPQNENSYFITSMTQDFVMPPLSQGFICLGGTIGRFNANVLNTGMTGEVSLQIDLTNIPIAGGVAVNPGESWYFQLWFRDNNPGQTSNFTDGICITFN